MLVLQRLIARIGVRLNSFLYVTASGVLAAMAAILFLQVALRYGMKISLPWTEEVARFLLVWFSLLSSSVAAHLGQHFAFGFVVGRLPGRLRTYVIAAVLLINMVAITALGAYCYRYLDIVNGLHATATGIDMRIPYASLPVSFLLLAFVFGAEFLDIVFSMSTGQRFSEWTQSWDEKTPSPAPAATEIA